jgi:hypothetical protein
MSSPALAQDEVYEQLRRNARRELQLAKLESRNYLQIEYPRMRRQLDAAITLTDAELRAYNERVRRYRPFDRFSTGSLYQLALQDLRLCILDAELRLRDLRAERNNLHRFRLEEWKTLEMRVDDARARVAEIEAAAENAAAEEDLPGG